MQRNVAVVVAYHTILTICSLLTDNTLENETSTRTAPRVWSRKATGANCDETTTLSLYSGRVDAIAKNKDVPCECPT